MKINYIHNSIYLLITLITVSACSKSENNVSKSTTQDINVSFSTSLAENTSSSINKAPLLLAFKHTQNEQVIWLSELDSKWNIIENNQYIMNCQLEVASYNFAFAKGLLLTNNSIIGNQGNQCFLNIEESTNYNKFNEYMLHHPINNQGNLQEAEILYLNTDAAEIKDLSKAEKLTFQTTLTHTQGRLDVIFAKKNEKDGNSQGTVSGNPLEKIQNISFTLNNINAIYPLDQKETSLINPDKRTYITSISESSFSNFDYFEYIKNFKESETDFPSDLKNYQEGKMKSWHFFPSKNIEGEMTIKYKNGYTETYLLKDIHTERNKATILVVWIYRDRLKLEIEGLGNKDLILWEEGEDEGFWN